MLDTETVSNFSDGVYLDWRVSGNVVITVTCLAGPSAVLSGLFLDAPPITAIPVNRDTTTQGNWIGTYGTQGYDIIGLSASFPPTPLSQSPRRQTTTSGMRARSIPWLCRYLGRLLGSSAIGPPPPASLCT